VRRRDLFPRRSIPRSWGTFGFDVRADDLSSVTYVTDSRSLPRIGTDVTNSTDSSANKQIIA
jgi:hypothetical protein